MEVIDKFTFNPKEGIDNPAMIQVSESEVIMTPTPRLCVLKREEGESFGFHLRVERGLQGHVVRQVTQWGVAERNGVKDGDRLLEVNENFVDDAEHSEIARQIYMSGTQLCLLLLDGKEYDWAVDQGYDLKVLSRAQRGKDWDPPRLCHITKDSSEGLGLRILPVEGEKGKFSMSPTSGGAAERAGVRKGDRLIWLDGVTVSELSHSAISKMVKKCDHITVLVIDPKSELTYAKRRMPILHTMATAHNLPHKPRRLRLDQAPDGYGFLLRHEKNASKQNVHVVREVEPGSPAERAGIVEGELLLEVNGELITHVKHSDVVNRIRQSGQQVTLTTISPQEQHFFSRLGVSPLFFHKDISAGEPSKSKVFKKTADSCSDPQCLPAEELRQPRLCVLHRSSRGYGFHLGCVLQKPGTYISQVAANGPGERAGLQRGDVVIEVNGKNVEEEYLEDVIMLIKEGTDSLSLLVVEPQEYENLMQSRNVVMSPEQRVNGS